MAFHNDLGIKGEDIACNFLKKSGYRILGRNFIYKKAEIDIIAENSPFIVFIEVKTRSNPDHAHAEDTVGKKKLHRIYEAADHYMDSHNILLEVRYDLITVIFHGDTWTIEHLQEAYYPFMNE